MHGIEIFCGGRTVATHRSNEQLLAEAEARAARLKRRIRSKERTERNRRLLLIGVAAERLFAEKGNADARARSLLNDYITSARDRKFLGLPPRKPKPDEANESNE